MKTGQSPTACGRVSATIAIVIAALAMVAPARAIEKTLVNDSFTGTGDLSCVQGFAAGEIGAARFSAEPADYPFTIQRVQVLLCPDGPAVDLVLHIWADDGASLDPGAVLWEEFITVTPSTSFLNEVDLSMENITVQSGAIRVGVEYFFSGSPPGIARDLDGITPLTNFIYAIAPVPEGWYFAEQFSVNGDWILRVVIDANDAPPLFVDGFESGDTTAWSATVP